MRRDFAGADGPAMAGAFVTDWGLTSGQGKVKLEAWSVGVELDSIAVGVCDLTAHKPAVILPFGFGDAGGAKPLARRPHS